jgi:nitrate reductase delta subunit
VTTGEPGRAAAAAAVVCQAASILLQYPDDEARRRLPLVGAAVAGLPPGPARDALRRFLGHVAATPAGELAEHYVATFDRNRRCCPYLTWWTEGETRGRGGALAELKERYRAHGLEFAGRFGAAAGSGTGSGAGSGTGSRTGSGTGDGRELPDYLPVMLEYAATGDLADGLALLQDHRAGVELLRLALADLGSPYAAVLAAVCTLLPGPSPADEAAARRLARSGPPTETVGLAPYAGHTGPMNR